MRDHNKALVGWLVVLRIYVASAVFLPYRDFEAGDVATLNVKTTLNVKIFTLRVND